MIASTVYTSLGLRQRPAGRLGMPALSVLALLLMPCWTGCASGKTKLLEVAAAAVSVPVAEVPADPLTRGFPLVHLQEDFRELQRYIETYHPRLYADRAALAELMETNFSLLREGMTETEFLRLLAPIVSALNCGHSWLSPSRAYQAKLSAEGRFFPLPLRFIDGRARVAGNGLYPAIPIGAELLTLNGRAMDGIITELFGTLSADGTNLTRKYWLLDQWFRQNLEIYAEYGDEFIITYRPENSDATRSARLEAAAEPSIMSANSAYFSARQQVYQYPFRSDFRDG